ncbi:ABC transporter substrate-binding protein [Parasphaerochaeta coccoides]|uniref:Extracellular solute-binding protein family 1 n=1 Tax=Parasphaerochaeta coccoides (strain ATCC BAA-1237 / DSM 17374 / SPN1) TaxID=760011 RepID=F4GI21_PARC1|nr:ABC transporter substrate-binding protein [Parasphaerochaeta coccoides]AEC02619.1 extracellular solute-binding protein family 1 [Parasphaerochaeta coccoides DSM 17374]
MKKTIRTMGFLFSFLFIALCLGTATLFAAGSREHERVSSGSRTVTWWHSNSGLRGQATDDLVAAFNATIGQEKGITVQAVYQGAATDITTKLRAVFQSGRAHDLPDIAQVDATGIIDVRASRELVPLNNLAARDGFDLSVIEPAALQSLMYKDTILGMPFNNSTILLYYNKTAFDEAGLDRAPRTLSEMADYAAKLTRRKTDGSIERHGFANVPTTYELVSWIGQQHVQQNGVSYLTDKRNGHDGNPTKVVFDENGTMKTFLTQWRKVWEAGGLANLTSGLTGEFAAGKVTMIVASTSNLTTILQTIDGRFELGVAYFPRVTENSDGGVNIGGGSLMAFDRGLNQTDAAWEFIKFASSAEQQFIWLEKTGYFPVNLGTYDLPETKEFLARNPLFQVAIDQLHDSNPALYGLWVPSAYQIYYVFQNGIRDFLENNRDIDATIATLSKEITTYLDDFNRANPE